MPATIEQVPMYTADVVVVLHVHRPIAGVGVWTVRRDPRPVNELRTAGGTVGRLQVGDAVGALPRVPVAAVLDVRLEET